MGSIQSKSNSFKRGEKIFYNLAQAVQDAEYDLGYTKEYDFRKSIKTRYNPSLTRALISAQDFMESEAIREDLTDKQYQAFENLMQTLTVRIHKIRNHP